MPASACSASITMVNVPEIADLITLKCVTVRSTPYSEQMHLHTVNSPMCRTTFYESSFFPYMAALRNSLTNECYPPYYDPHIIQGEG